MTSLHGIAFNVSTELDYDRLINPCGLLDRGLTSLARETQRPVSMDAAKSALFAAFEKVFDIEFITATETANVA
jgi:lipoyl(octanoyl) transferase